ncbi:MAG: DUF4276 family protein [Thermoflexales bacterium]
MNAYLYLEGGAQGQHSKSLNMRCQQAFHMLLSRMGFAGRMPRIVACGSRNDAYERFTREHSGNRTGYVAMLIDSEEPMTDVDKPWDHFARVTTVGKWTRPNSATDEQVLTMTTCMETWIVADQAALVKHYGKRLAASALPSASNLESQTRLDIQKDLERATSNCSNAYQKGARSFLVLSVLDPATLEKLLPSFARLHRILNSKL